MCVSEVLCLKRMNHLLCRRDAGRIGGVMLERDKKRVKRFRSIVTSINLFRFYFLFVISLLKCVVRLHDESTRQESNPISIAQSLTAILMCDSHNKHLSTHSNSTGSNHLTYFHLHSPLPPWLHETMGTNPGRTIEEALQTRCQITFSFTNMCVSACLCVCARVCIDVIICVPLHITQFSIAVNEFCQCFCISITQWK